MNVFYFCSPAGVKVLEDLEVKITRPAEFNDPFEFLPRPNGSKRFSDEEAKMCESFHLTGAQFFHYLCFCRGYQNPRMWAQYAADHHGLVIEFDLGKEPFSNFTIENGGLLEVHYDKNERVPISECQVRDSERFKKISSRKGSAWKDEEEFRIMIPRYLVEQNVLQIRETIVGERVLTLWQITEGSIVSVTLGLRASADLRYTVKRLLEMKLKDVKLYEARCHNSEFTMERRPLSLLRMRGNSPSKFK